MMIVWADTREVRREKRAIALSGIDDRRSILDVWLERVAAD